MLIDFQVYENGVVEGGIDFYFNLSGAMKGIEGGHDAKEKILQRVGTCDELSALTWKLEVRAFGYYNITYQFQVVIKFPF